MFGRQASGPRGKAIELDSIELENTLGARNGIMMANLAQRKRVRYVIPAQETTSVSDRASMTDLGAYMKSVRSEN